MAYGRFGGGDGSAANPYLIEDAADLDEIRNHPSSNFKLMNSINLGVSPYNIGKGWVPILNFTGMLDGNGKKIFNLYINRSDEDNVGFFASWSYNLIGSDGQYYTSYIVNASNFYTHVKDLGFENAIVYGRYNVGILIGSISTSFKADSINGASSWLSPEYRWATRCYAVGKVSGLSKVGGLVGQVYMYADYINAYYNNWSNYGVWNPTYQWEVLGDCRVDVDIISLGVNQYFGLLVGGTICPGNGTTRTIRYVNVVAVGTVAEQGGPIAPYSITEATGSLSLTLSNCFYDSDVFGVGGVQSSGSIALTTAQMKNAVPTLELLGTTRLTDNTPVWEVYAKNYPRLWFTYQAYYFFVANNQYYTYDVANKTWDKYSDSMPSREQAVADGMTNLWDINTEALYKLKQIDTQPDLIAIIEKPEQAQSLSKVLGFDKDVTHSDDNKIYYQQSINMADFGNSIVGFNS